MTWSHTEIRQARCTPLGPVVRRLGYELAVGSEGNRIIVGLSTEIVIKDHYWVCTEDGVGGNAIDFLMSIEGMNFAQAMRLLRS